MVVSLKLLHCVLHDDDVNLMEHIGLNGEHAIDSSQ